MFAPRRTSAYKHYAWFSLNMNKVSEYTGRRASHGASPLWEHIKDHLADLCSPLERCKHWFRQAIRVMGSIAAPLLIGTYLMSHEILFTIITSSGNRIKRTFIVAQYPFLDAIINDVSSLSSCASTDAPEASRAYYAESQLTSEQLFPLSDGVK